MTSDGHAMRWPTDKLNALRLGRRLVTEVAAGEPGRRSFVEIRPIATTGDRDAGFDYDTGALLVRAAIVTGEAQLTAALEIWNLQPEQFRYPWQTDDPR